MSERTTERTRESDSDAGASATGSTSSDDLQADTETKTQSGSYFSVRALLVAFVAIGGGMTLGSLIPLIPYTALLGIPLGSFLHGLLDTERRYIETALAGGVLSGVVGVLPLLPRLLAGLNGTRLFAIAAAVGLFLAVAGHYLGRDLRDGLTRDLTDEA